MPKMAKKNANANRKRKGQRKVGMHPDCPLIKGALAVVEDGQCNLVCGPRCQWHIKWNSSRSELPGEDFDIFKQ